MIRWLLQGATCRGALVPDTFIWDLLQDLCRGFGLQSKWLELVKREDLQDGTIKLSGWSKQLQAS